MSEIEEAGPEEVAEAIEEREEEIGGIEIPVIERPMREDTLVALIAALAGGLVSGSILQSRGTVMAGLALLAAFALAVWIMPEEAGLDG
jgi:hypothetical protein